MTDTKIEQDLYLVKIQKRDRHYKRRYLQARNAAICLFCLLTLMAFVVGWALHGNSTLQRRLNDSKTMTILPSGKTLIGK